MARARYIWKGLNKHIKAIIKTCDACQKSKTARHERAKPGTYPSSRTRFKNIHLDLVGPVEQSSGDHKHLLTIIDRSMRFPVAIPFLNTDAQTIWRSLEASWIQLFGKLVNLITDQGSQFTAIGLNSARPTTSTTAAYNLQQNGLVERWHRVLKDTLKGTANKHQDWVDRLPILLLGLRARPSSDSGLSPHQMVFGTEPYFVPRDMQEIGGTEFYDRLQRARQGYVYPDPTTH